MMTRLRPIEPTPPRVPDSLLVSGAEMSALLRGDQRRAITILQSLTPAELCMQATAYVLHLQSLGADLTEAQVLGIWKFLTAPNMTDVWWVSPRVYSGWYGGKALSAEETPGAILARLDAMHAAQWAAALPEG